MEYTTLSEQMSLQEYVNNERLAEQLLNAVRQSNKYPVSELDNESRERKWLSDCNHERISRQLHGQYPAKITDTSNNQKAFEWQKECGLNIETEALITAAQDQALNTKHHQTQVLGINEDFKYRTCSETNETVPHIVNMCPRNDY